MRAQDFAAQPSDVVLNQSPALEDYNLFEHDTPLREALAREGGGWIEDEALAFGEVCGRAETLRLGDVANTYTPEHVPYDRFGHRVDRIDYHPAYHALMTLSAERGLHALPWSAGRDGAQVARAGLYHLRHQVEQGTSCPITMTFAVVPSLRLQPELAEVWVPRVLTNRYDPRFIPADQKEGALFGMAMTERQGGSDVRANTTRATPLNGGGSGGEYRLNGHKWFCSAPMCDAFLVLAYAPGGLSCFLLPRFTPDGELNRGFEINRLKSKLGNRSNASSEITLRDAWAQLIGGEGRGVPTIIEMVRHTRLDCTIGGASLIRRCVAEATHHAAHRHAFGRRLIEQPLMKNVLADLCLESEGATALAFRLARAFDSAAESEAEARLARLGTAIAKYWICKRETDVAREALECLGGNGFVEEAPLARLFRESPLNSIWEGSGNVQCLDVLRAISRDPSTLEAVFDVLGEARGADARYDRFLVKLAEEVRDPDHIELRARRLVERLALGLQASLLLQHSPGGVADAFCASRLDGDHGQMFGTLPPGVELELIIDRSLPKVAPR